jgi:hypothetical protein
MICFTYTSYHPDCFDTCNFLLSTSHRQSGINMRQLSILRKVYTTGVVSQHCVRRACFNDKDFCGFINHFSVTIAHFSKSSSECQKRGCTGEMSSLSTYSFKCSHSRNCVNQLTIIIDTLYPWLNILLSGTCSFIFLWFNGFLDDHCYFSWKIILPLGHPALVWSKLLEHWL